MKRFDYFVFHAFCHDISGVILPLGRKMGTNKLLLPGYAAVAAAIPENVSSRHLSVISFKMAT